jgi:hypothetical protein
VVVDIRLGSDTTSLGSRSILINTSQTSGTTSQNDSSTGNFPISIPPCIYFDLDVLTLPTLWSRIRVGSQCDRKTLFILRVILGFVMEDPSWKLPKMPWYEPLIILSIWANQLIKPIDVALKKYAHIPVTEFVIAARLENGEQATYTSASLKQYRSMILTEEFEKCFQHFSRRVAGDGSPSANPGQGKKYAIIKLAIANMV